MGLIIIGKTNIYFIMLLMWGKFCGLLVLVPTMCEGWKWKGWKKGNGDQS